MAHELPELPYDYNALEPHIDARTMKIHHTKHHQTYINNLNSALEKHPGLGDKGVEELLKDLNSIPDDIRIAVRNSGGGHANHSFFWPCMSPDGGDEPSGDLASSINSSFGSIDSFKGKIIFVGSVEEAQNTDIPELKDFILGKLNDDEQ